MADDVLKREALSVSGALALAKDALEAFTVTLVGEVSEVSVKPGYKAAYFTVKDSKSSLPCMMWNNRYKAQGIDLAVGQLVQLTGRFSLYAAKGRMNFDVFSISLAGEGDLRVKVANIAKKLKAEGLTDASRKRALPEFPERIGLVTSPRGAAVHDVLRTLRRRFPTAEVLLAGVPVEGASAPAGIIEGIECVVGAGAEVVLVVRGGGSFEDLMPFNDERLARYIASCAVPVVTGIGHEVDTSIADMVSDVRASTPTAAAEAVSPSRENLDALLKAHGRSMPATLGRRLEKTRDRLDMLAGKPLFKDSMLLFASEAQWLDATADRLNRSLPDVIEGKGRQLDAARIRLCGQGSHMLDRFQRGLSSFAAGIEALSPVHTLARGFAVARTEEGAFLRSVENVKRGDAIDVVLADGSLECTVNAVSEGMPLDEMRKDQRS